MYRVIMALLTLTTLSLSPLRGAEPPTSTPIRAGMIGLDTSHVIAFTQLINDPKAEGVLGAVEVVAAYPGGSPDIPSSRDRVEGYTEQLRAKGIRICASIPEMLELVDAVFLESVDGRPHLEQARPVIAAGKPLFIDKPMAGSLADALEIFRLAREKNVPVWSASSLRYAAGFQAARRGELGVGPVRGCVAWSPMSIEPHHPDLFWYGIHGVETLFTIMGTGCERVTRVGPEEVVGQWKEGREGVFASKDQVKKYISETDLGQKDVPAYGAVVTGTEGTKFAGSYDGYRGLVEEVCRFFQTRQPPVAEEETIEILAFMEAADESKRRGGAPVTLREVLDAARQGKAASN